MCAVLHTRYTSEKTHHVKWRTFFPSFLLFLYTRSFSSKNKNEEKTRSESELEAAFSWTRWCLAFGQEPSRRGHSVGSPSKTEGWTNRHLGNEEPLRRAHRQRGRPSPTPSTQQILLETRHSTSAAEISGLAARAIRGGEAPLGPFSLFARTWSDPDALHSLTLPLDDGRHHKTQKLKAEPKQ